MGHLTATTGFAERTRLSPWNASAIGTFDQQNPVHWSAGAGYAG
jgi:hypothetical protein